MAYPLLSGTQFKSFSYVNAPSQGYLLYNDIADNQEKMQKGKSMTVIQGQGDYEGYYFGNNVSGIPKGAKVLRSKGKDRNLILFASAYYDETNKEYIVMNRSLIKGKKSAQVVWLRPQ